MSKPILVAYDPRTADRAPVEFGLAAAKFTGARLIVASVSARTGGAEEDLLSDASDALGAVKSDLEGEGIAVECRELDGTSAARALHEAAEAEDAGLMVVGSTTRGAAGRVLPGSTADRLIHGAACAIAIVPHGWTAGAGVKTIGAAYADTDEGRTALREAYALARRWGATLRALTAVTGGLTRYAETVAGTNVRSSKDSTDVEGERRAEAERALAEAVAALGDDVDVQTDAYVEDPAEVLIRVSEHLDLLVCGSRGYGPLRAVLLGGVTRRLALEAQCPVIVLARGVESALDDLVAEAPAAG